jgi:hypothetical protein
MSLPFQTKAARFGSGKLRGLINIDLFWNGRSYQETQGNYCLFLESSVGTLCTHSVILIPSAACLRFPDPQEIPIERMREQAAA